MTAAGRPLPKATPDQAERLHRFAHDLRNRLAGIQQVLVQLRDQPSEQQAELLEFAEQQYFRAMRSTEDLLDAFAVDRGVSALTLARLDLGELATAAVPLVEHRLERKSQTLQLDLANGVMVDGDAHWIKEIIVALFSNASKFGAPGGTIRVSLNRSANDAVLTVQDDGAGLDTEDLAEVFSRYAWLKSRSTAGEAQARSTLARARQWAEAHEGSLTAASEGPGRGSTFTLRLRSAS